MKTKTVLILTAAASLWMSLSCQKLSQNDDFRDSSWFATADQRETCEAGERRVTVYTTCSWTAVSSNPEWVTVSPVSGEAGIHELTLKFSANDGPQSRTATIDCKAGEYTDTYTITQAAR